MSLIGKWFEWLANCFADICQHRREILPKKAAKIDYPQIYFVAPPQHRFFMDNDGRKILMHCMEATVKTVNNVRLIKMMEIWNPNNLQLVTKESQITSAGLTAYWASVNAAVAFNINKKASWLHAELFFFEE